MIVLIRTLLIWFLVLAVPAQTSAAATMAFCGPGHHSGDQASSSQSLAAVGAVLDGHGAHSAHEAVAEPDEHFTASMNGWTPLEVARGDKHKCSACASCCSSGAILSAMPELAAPEVSATEFVSVVETVDTFTTSGPDRPPRAVFA